MDLNGFKCIYMNSKCIHILILIAYTKKDFNPFSQSNFWSMSPHCTGRIAKFLILRRISHRWCCIFFYSVNTQWSFQLCSELGCIYDLRLLHLEKNFQSCGAFHIKLCCIYPSSCATHNDHFNSVLGLGAFMIWSNCI